MNPRDVVDAWDQLPGDADAAICIAVLIHVIKPAGQLFLDWPTSLNPAEGVVWTDVTTWHPDAQADLARDLGLERIHVRRPWQVYQRGLSDRGTA